MEIVILTGMSGSGKSKATNYLEDMGYFCIDNIPTQMLSNMIGLFNELVKNSKSSIQKLAFVVDIRSAMAFEEVEDNLFAIENLDFDYTLIFLESTDEVLISRYKQSRRIHPLASQIGVAEAIKFERKKLMPLKLKADEIIDTTNLTLPELRNYLYKLLQKSDELDERMDIFIQSFGFKYGIPVDADIIQDVRFIHNPYYDPELRVLTGLDEPVRENVFSHAITQTYSKQLVQMMSDLIPYYIKEGKARLLIAIGCTGGRHRSVALSEFLAQQLIECGLKVQVSHRDINLDPQNRRKIQDYRV